MTGRPPTCSSTHCQPSRESCWHSGIELKCCGQSNAPYYSTAVLYQTHCLAVPQSHRSVSANAYSGCCISQLQQAGTVAVGFGLTWSRLSHPQPTISKHLNISLLKQYPTKKSFVVGYGLSINIALMCLLMGGLGRMCALTQEKYTSQTGTVSCRICHINGTIDGKSVSTSTDTVYVVLAVLIRTNVDGSRPSLRLSTVYAVSGTVCTVFFTVSVP